MAASPIVATTAGRGRGRSLEIGLVLPTLTPLGGATPGWRDHLAFARAAEAVGFDSIWVGLAGGLRAFARQGVGLLQLGISPVTPTAVEEFERVLERLDAGE